MIILVMGLPGSGKTTLAKELAIKLKAIHFNADQVRATISKDLGFSITDRIEQAKRMRILCETAKSKYVIADFVCPTNETRLAFGGCFTIWMDRIKKSRFDDTNLIFEPPLNYDIRIKNGLTIEQQLDTILKKYKE